MEFDEKKLQEILTKYGVTVWEYDAMHCPYYEIPLNPKEMAIHTVLELGGNADGTFTADEYLHAIQEMIEKGWLTIATQNDCTKRKKTLNIPERTDYDGLTPGDVIFTQVGFFLHRKILKDMFGAKFVQRNDSFYTIERKACRIDFYGETEEICHDWLFEIHQKTGDSNISCIVGAPAEIIRSSNPVHIGKWKPSRFLILEQGYHCRITYKQLEELTLRIPTLNLISTVERFTPLYISGTIEGENFSFFEDVGWLFEKMDKDRKPSDHSAVFN